MAPPNWARYSVSNPPVSAGMPPHPCSSPIISTIIVKAGILQILRKSRKTSNYRLIHIRRRDQICPVRCLCATADVCTQPCYVLNVVYHMEAPSFQYPFLCHNCKRANPVRNASTLANLVLRLCFAFIICSCRVRRARDDRVSQHVENLSEHVNAVGTRFLTAYSWLAIVRPSSVQHTVLLTTAGQHELLASTVHGASTYSIRACCDAPSFVCA